MSRKKSSKEMTLFMRCYQVTLGVILASVAIYFGVKNSASLTEHPVILAIFIAVILVGATLVLIGLKAPSKKVHSWAEAAFRHEGGLIVIAVAYPVYWIMKRFINKK